VNVWLLSIVWYFLYRGGLALSAMFATIASIAAILLRAVTMFCRNNSGWIFFSVFHFPFRLVLLATNIIGI